jgi:hypothetical protein
MNYRQTSCTDAHRHQWRQLAYFQVVVYVYSNRL